MPAATRPSGRMAAHSPAGEPGSAQAAARGRVLVVEDEYLLALENETALREAGYEVVGIAARADDAVKLAGAERPDLVLMDIRLVGPRDGVEAAVEIARRFGIAVVFASALTGPETRARAASALALGWLAKPYSSDSMLDAVARAMDLLRGQGH